MLREKESRVWPCKCSGHLATNMLWILASAWEAVQSCLRFQGSCEALCWDGFRETDVLLIPELLVLSIFYPFMRYQLCKRHLGTDGSSQDSAPETGLLTPWYGVTQCHLALGRKNTWNAVAFLPTCAVFDVTCFSLSSSLTFEA